MKAESSEAKLELPFNYIILMLIIVVAAAVISTLVVKALVKGTSMYTAVYFTATVLFDVVGVDASTGILSKLHTVGISFDKLFIVLVADGIIKIVLIGFILAGVIDVITKLNLHERVIKFRIRRSNKIIMVAGYGSLSEEICNLFSTSKIEFVIIEKDTKYKDIFTSKNYNYIFGDFTENKILLDAGVERSKKIVFGIGNDFENTLGIMGSRNLNKKIKIISRAEDDISAANMKYVGADVCVVPEVLTADQISKVLLGVFKV